MNKDHFGLIVGLVILAGLLLAGFILYRTVKRKISNFSRTLFGTSNLVEGYKKQQAELAETPRSLPAMTKIYLPQISSDFPEFNYTEYKQKSENLLKSYLLAISAKDISKLVNASPEIEEQVMSIITDLEASSLTEHFNEICIHRTEITRYIKENGVCTVFLQSAIEFFNYLTNDNTGAVTSGSETLKKQTVYETELTYVQDVSKIGNAGDDKAMGLNCPNCGAPITSVGQKVCAYCGSGIKEINIYSWSFNKIREITVSRKKY